MALRVKTLALTPEGAAEAATAKGTVGLPPGELVGVQVAYTGQPATCDVTVSSLGRAVLTLTNANTSKFVQLAGDVVTSAGAAIANASAQNPVVGLITAEVAEGSPVVEGVVLTFFVRE